MSMTASYDPADNKLRLRAAERLDSATYERVRAAGFKWAPRQELFAAPMWTPEREDLLLELCGEIGDEDTTLVDRAEERAERFTDYSAARREDAEQAHEAVSAIADSIPLGQPINGPKQQEALRPLADQWEDLPAGTFKEAGTAVNAALLVIEAPEESDGPKAERPAPTGREAANESGLATASRPTQSALTIPGLAEAAAEAHDTRAKLDGERLWLSSKRLQCAS